MLKRLTAKWFGIIFALMITGLTVIGCSSSDTVTNGVSTSTSPSGANLNGAGATFPNPLYTKWFDEYYKTTGNKINYQAVGSGAGIQQITAGTVDFGASDGIMTQEQQSLAEASGGPILHIPMTSGAVAIIYNVPGIDTGQLKLTGTVLADIYLKRIIKWNDPAIAVLNPDLHLPDTDIAVVHRSDGSGTTFIVTNYLSKISDDWRIKVGNATSVSWPGDIGGQGNAGVAGQVKNITSSIGYVELAYAKQNNLPYAQLQNISGNYLLPSLEGATAASEGIGLPDHMKIMITNSSNPDAYPIVGFTWILAYVNQKNEIKGKILAEVLRWAVHEGQQYCTSLDYAPLSSAAVANTEKLIQSLQFGGKPILSQ
ncbi:MAG: phosphate ABC transporter substrate-binding protein PstS [Dehalococcoidales bacterium]|nr:phosphate ABC transporter substrate-binding protein PstS [Dehalococcoidales bacterium]